MTWPRGSRFGSGKTPTSRFTRVSRPVSSWTSRTTASTVVSPSSTKPPGSAGIPRYGSFLRRTATSLPFWRTIPSTATEGWAPATMTSLAGGHPDAMLVREADGVLVPGVRMADHAHSRVRRQDASDPAFRVLGAVAHDQGARMGRIPDADAAAVVDCDQVRARRGVQERIQQRPVGDRVGSVAHPFRLAVGGGHRPRVKVVPRDDDRPAELARRYHAVDRSAKRRTLSEAEPAYAGGEAFPREVLLREADPPGERLVPWELPQDHAVRLDDVFRVSRHRDPSERPTALREEGPDEERDESLKGECVLDAGLFRLASDVVPVVEHDAPGPEEVEHRSHVDRDRFARAADVLLRIVRTQGGRGLDCEPAGDVSAERVVCARLVRHDIGSNVAMHKFRVDVGAVPDEPDGERRPTRLRLEGHFQCFVEFEHDSIAVSVRHTPSDAGLVDLDVEADAFVHLDGERLRAAHAAHPSGQDESALQRAA